MIRGTARLIQTAGFCFAVSALTTLGLIFLPDFFPDVPDFEARTRLVLNPVYMSHRWTALTHPLIVLVGAIGVAALRVKEAPGSTITGLVFFALWAGTEAVQQALTLVAVDWTWRPQYLAATSETERTALRAHILGFEPLSNGLFFLLVIAFICANLLYARAAWGERPLQRVVSVGFGFAAMLGVISLLTNFAGDLVPAPVMDILYPTLQPAARLTTGIWLLLAAAGETGASAPVA
jgi:hypothetical protein